MNLAILLAAEPQFLPQACGIQPGVDRAAHRLALAPFLRSPSPWCFTEIYNLPGRGAPAQAKAA